MDWWIVMDRWHGFRWWLASKIVGINLEDEIDAAYEAGVDYGQAKRFLDEQRDDRTAI